MRKIYLSLALCVLASLMFTVDTFGQMIQLGSGTSTNGTTTSSPVNIWYRRTVSQFVYTAAEINAAGVTSASDLNAMGFYVTASPIYDIPNYTIKIKHVTQTNVATALGTTGWTTVKNGFTYNPTAGGYDMIQFDTPFSWNGTDNIGVELCWSQVQPSFSSTGQCRLYSTSSGYRYSWTDAGGTSCGSTPNTQNSNKPQAQLDFSPAGLPNDAGIESIDVGMPTCSFKDSVFVNMTNYGINTLTQVGIDWELNGVAQTGINWTGNLASGATDNPINLGSGYTFQEGDIIKVWTSGTINNGTPDDSLLNDTATLELRLGLNGLYTIDLSGNGDFMDFNEAFQAAKDLGVCGDVVFESQGGQWNEFLSLETVPLQSDTSTITFRSASGDPTTDTLWVSGGTNGTQVLDFDDADWFRFEYLTLWNNSNDPRVITVRGGSDNNIIHGCDIIGTQQNSTSFNDAIIFSDNDLDNNNHIVDNYIYGGSYGILWEGINTASLEEGTVIEGNEIIDSYYSAIRMYYENAPQVRNNYIAGDVAYTAGRGIWAYYCDNDMIIDGNHIDADSTDWPQYGLFLGYNDGSALNQGVISNNKIHLGAGVSSDDHWGIYTLQGGFSNIWNNSIVINTTNINGRGYYANNSSTNTFVNNIIEISNNGLAYDILGSGAIHIGDYNNIRSNNAVFAELDNTPYTTYNDWVVGTGYDQNTTQVDPLFNNVFEMRPCNDTLDGAGLSTPLVPMDFDGQMRGSTPDIGADEYTALSNWDIGDDTGICSGDVLTLQVLYADTAVWSNPSTVLDTGNTFTIQSPNTYYVNAITSCGAVSDSIVIEAPHSLSMANNENVCPGTTTTLSAGTAVGSFNWSNGETTSDITVGTAGTYVLQMTDEFGCNMSDTTVVTVSPEVNLPDTLAICDGSVEFLDAQISGNYAWNNGTTSQTIAVQNSGTYAVTVTDQFACVSEDSTIAIVTPIPTAVIADSISFLTVAFDATISDYNNLVWDFGDGTFSNDEDPIHVFPWPGGTFTVTLTINNECGTFTIENEVTVDTENSTGLNDLISGESEMVVYPNPSNGEFTLGYNAAEHGDLNIEIMNIQGQIVYSNIQNAVNGLNQYSINLDGLAGGVYMIKTTLNNEVKVSRITLR